MIPEAGTQICPVGDDPACEPATITLERNATLDLDGFNLIPAFEPDVLRDTCAQQIASGDRPSSIRSEFMESEIVGDGATWGVCKLD